MMLLPQAKRSVQSGFTLVELMVSMVLGLLVVGAAGGLFLSNRKVYGTSEAVNRIQENQRSAFEMFARDVREAGGNPCTRNVVNMLDTSKPKGDYYTTWGNGVSGTNGTGPNGSDEIILYTANGASYAVTESDNPSAELGLNSVAGITTNDILMVCNAEVASIFQVTNVANGKIGHGSGSGDPGNLEKPFQIDQETFDKDTSAQTGYCFLPPATGANPNCLNPPSGSPAQVIAPLAIRWYVAANGRNGTSLYRQEIRNGGGSVGAAAEIAEGVTRMEITYKVGTATYYVDAAPTLAWKDVKAVNARITFQAVRGALSQSDTEGTDNAVLTRALDDYIVLRNHQDNIQ